MLAWLQGSIELEERPVLDVGVSVKNKKLVIGTIEMDPEDFGCLLRSIVGRGMVINLKTGGAGVKSIAEIPDWLKKILLNYGYNSLVPKLAPLQEQPAYNLTSSRLKKTISFRSRKILLVGIS